MSFSILELCFPLREKKTEELFQENSFFSQDPVGFYNQRLARFEHFVYKGFVWIQVNLWNSSTASVISKKMIDHTDIEEHLQVSLRLKKKQEGGGRRGIKHQLDCIKRQYLLCLDLLCLDWY